MDAPAARRLRLLGALLGVLVVAAVAFVVLGGTLDEVRALVERAGVWGPVVYVALHVLLCLVPVPRNVLAVIAGALFGLVGGVALAWTGSVLAAAAGFVLARHLGQAAVAELTGRRIVRVQRLLREEGLTSVLVLRLTPFLPFTLVTYVCGVSALPRREYAVGTALGVLPGTVAYVLVGASAVQDSTTFLLGAGAAAALLVATVAVGRRLRARARPGV